MVLDEWCMGVLHVSLHATTGVPAFLLTTSYDLEQLEQCLVCDLAKIFVTSKFSSLDKTGTANRWELLIANHLDQSFSFANRKQGAAVRSYLLDSS
jgi:hypothetical protein